MIALRLQVLCLFRIFSAAAAACEGPSCAKPLEQAALLQVRHNDQVSKTAVEEDQESESQGEMVQVACHPACRGVAAFSMIVASPTRGNLTFDVERNTRLAEGRSFFTTRHPSGKGVLRKQIPVSFLDCHYQGSDIAVSTCHGLSARLDLDGHTHKLTELADGSFKLGGDDPDVEPASLLQFQDEGDEMAANVCGNGVVDAGEDCDGGDCCTATCVFEAQDVECSPQTGPCNSGGQCTGAASYCELKTATDGVQCGQSGMCYQGECASRDEQCKDEGFVSACDTAQCEELKCLNADGECIVAADDVSMVPGSPCGEPGDKRQCEGIPRECKASTAAMAFGGTDTTFDFTPQSATTSGKLAVPVTFVVTQRAFDNGFNLGKVTALANYLDKTYSTNSNGQAGMNVQIDLHEIYVDKSGTTDDWRAEIGHLDKFKDQVKAWKKDNTLTSGFASAQLLTGPNLGKSPCYGTIGMAWLGTLCTDAGVGINVVSKKKGKGTCDRDHFHTVAHELGHNFGMPHLWTNKNGKKEKGSTGYMMDYGPNDVDEFHSSSQKSYQQKLATGKFACLKAAGPTPAPAPCGDDCRKAPTSPPGSLGIPDSSSIR